MPAEYPAQQLARNPAVRYDLRMLAFRWPYSSQCIAALLLLGSCSGPSAQTPPTTETRAPASPPKSGTGGSDVPHPTEAECEALLDHTLGLLLQKMRDTQDPESIPTEAQVAQIRRSMRESEFDACLEGDKSLVECGLAAGNVDDLSRCEPSKASD